MFMSFSRKPGRPFIVFLAALVAFGGVYLLMVGTYRGQRVDDRMMASWSGALGHAVPTSGWLSSAQAPLLVVGVALIAAVCALRRSWRLGLRASAVVGGALVSSVVLKSALARPDLGIGPPGNSMPSNTVTAFAAVAVTLVVVAPPRLRAAASTAATATVVTVSLTVVGLQWHRPSDVVAGVLLAVAAAAAVECAARAWSVRILEGGDTPRTPKRPPDCAAPARRDRYAR